MKYRPHRGSLHDSMAETVELSDRRALINHLAANLEEWGFTLTDDDIRVQPYGYDDRIKWNTHIVVMRNMKRADDQWYFGETTGPDYFGAIGYTDGPA